MDTTDFTGLTLTTPPTRGRCKYPPHLHRNSSTSTHHPTTDGDCVIIRHIRLSNKYDGLTGHRNLSGLLNSK